MKGKIFRIFANRSGGFIIGDDHRRYLFWFKDIAIDMATLEVGQRVDFDGYDDGMGDKARRISADRES